MIDFGGDAPGAYLPVLAVLERTEHVRKTYRKRYDIA